MIVVSIRIGHVEARLLAVSSLDTIAILVSLPRCLANAPQSRWRSPQIDIEPSQGTPRLVPCKQTTRSFVM
jgi:hypothetical protein